MGKVFNTLEKIVDTIWEVSKYLIVIFIIMIGIFIIRWQNNINESLIEQIAEYREIAKEMETQKSIEEKIKSQNKYLIQLKKLNEGYGSVIVEREKLEKKKEK